MANETTKIVLEYLDKYSDKLKSKKIGKNTLAKIILRDNPTVFKNTEPIRNTIRRYTGSNGKETRMAMTTTKFYDDEAMAKLSNAFDLPESDEETPEMLNFTLPKVCNNILALFDAHVPYHNILALNTALNYGLKHEVNTIILQEFLDCYHLSRFEQNPKKRNQKGEIEVLQRLLDKIRKLFPNASIYYHNGNHEERWEKGLWNNPNFSDFDEFKLDHIAQFNNFGIKYIDNRRRIKAGKLSIVHGHEVNVACGMQNPAFSLFNKTGASTMCGHVHKASEYSKTSINDELTTCWTVGCLSELHPYFLRFNGWGHGFAHIRVKNSGDFKVFNARIDKGVLR